MDEDFESQEVYLEEDNTLEILRKVNVKKPKGRDLTRQEGNSSLFMSTLGLNIDNTPDSVMMTLLPENSIYKDVQIPADSLERIKKAVKASDYGPVATVSMMCLGERCKINEKCPFFKEGIAPVGEECIWEKQLSVLWMKRYIDEFEVDLTSRSTLQIISQLVELDILIMRMTTWTSLHGNFMMQDDICSVDPLGNEHTNININKAFDIKERLSKERLKILEVLTVIRDRKRLAESMTKRVANSSLDRFQSMRSEVIEYAKAKKEKG